ncbi:MAG: hypothetical protein ACOC6C_04880 [Verrucomicrobiota bacterium]
MSKRMLWALILIAACAIVFVANAGKHASVRLIPGIDLSIDGMSALIYLAFVITGVIIGSLLK